jgi:DNA transposition AAA+ family ATPase
MNTPDNLPVDVDEQRSWLLAHKDLSGLSWPALATQMGLKSGTISVFATGKYQGDNDRIARDIFRFRQKLTSQADLALDAPIIPGYFDTPTSRRVQSTLLWGQRGRMVAMAMGPGTGKTTALLNFRDAMSNVWVVTMSPSSAGVNNMCIKVLEALGEKGARGSSQSLSARIRERLTGTGGLLAFDEAQHLSVPALEEIRSWHDETGVGIALLGNETVVSRIEGGQRKAIFAQLYSRISMRHVQALPLKEDAEALAAAWEVTEERQVRYIVKQASMPGGLRGVTMMMELATVIANGDREPRTLSHLTDAWAQLTSRPLGA